jgi:glutamyl-tRNA reductase
MELLMLGTSHRDADLATRESLAFSPEEAMELVREVAVDAAVHEAAAVCTCNRTELYAVVDDVEAGASCLREAVRRRRPDDPLAPEEALAPKVGVEAAAHLHRVAAGLDSLVIGEKQILGQVKQAWCDSAAVALAGKVCGDLQGRDLVVVGAGETARLAAVHFAERRPSRLRVVNRTRERALALAAEVGAEVCALESLPEVLAGADVVALATRAPHAVLAAATVAAALRRRPHRPLVLLDLAVPRDVEPEAASLENVFLYPIDALRGLVDQSLARRRREAPRAEAIALEECGRFLAWWRGLGATPVVRELREHFERVRAEELARSRRLFSPDEQERFDRLTQSLVNKLLHLPTTRLKSFDPASREGARRLDAVRELFALGAQPGAGERDREA